MTTLPESTTAHNLSQNPMIFWAMFVVAVLAIGILITQQLESWYLRWSAKRRDEIQRNSPSVMRQRIKDLEKALAWFKEKNEALSQEVDSLNRRNRFMANEIRYDPGSKTLNWDAIKPYRQR